MAQTSLDQPGDDGLALQANQGRRPDDVQRLFAQGLADGGRGRVPDQTPRLNTGHGRIATRRDCGIRAERDIR
jgi:hypothetical protein